MPEDYPFVQARWFTRGRRRRPRLVVVHSAETAERGDTAERVAEFFRTVDRKCSAHITVDADSVVRSVRDDDTAFGAAGANTDGLHVEHAGRARQTRDEWLDDYGDRLLRRSAEAAARWARAYGIPAVRLTREQVADRRTKGFTDHATVSAAFPEKSTGHTDPGPHFPWDVWLDLVRGFLGQAPGGPDRDEEGEGDELTRFVKTAGSPAVYVTNGIHRRWVKTQAKKAELVRLGVEDTVVEISQDGLDDLQLVGPAPG